MKKTLVLFLFSIKIVFGQNDCPKYAGNSNGALEDTFKKHCSNIFLGDDSSFVFTDGLTQSIYFRLEESGSIIKTDYRIIHHIQTEINQDGSTNHYVFGETTKGMNVSKIVRKKNTVSFDKKYFLGENCKLEIGKMTFDDCGLLRYQSCDNTAQCGPYKVMRKDSVNINIDLPTSTTITKISPCDSASKLIVINDSVICQYDSLNKTINSVSIEKITFDKIYYFSDGLAKIDLGEYSNYLKYKNNKFEELFEYGKDSVSTFKKKYAIVKDSKKYAIINESGNPLDVNGGKFFDWVVRLPNSSWYVLQNNKESVNTILYNPIISNTTDKLPFLKDKNYTIRLLFENSTVAYFWVKVDKTKNQLLIYNHSKKRFEGPIDLKQEVNYISQSLQEEYFMYSIYKLDNKGEVEKEDDGQPKIRENKYFKIKGKKIIYANSNENFTISYPIIKGFAIDDKKIIDAETLFKP